MAVVGHELRTPVTTIRGLVDALATAPVEEVRERIAPALGRLTARLERLLDDLLLAAGIMTALPVGAPVPHEVAPAVREAWAGLGLDPDRLVLGGDPGARVMAVPHGLARVLAAVLDNAAKYGQGPVEVDVAAGPAEVTVSVTSRGPTPPAADLAMAFEPFYRGEAAVMAAPGLGVGLPVARAIAAQVGGRVELDTAEGGGVVARVVLPAAP
jgi:two-component system OmpR family sensor kinase